MPQVRLGQRLQPLQQPAHSLQHPALALGLAQGGKLRPADGGATVKVKQRLVAGLARGVQPLGQQLIQRSAVQRRAAQQHLRRLLG